MRLRRPVFVVTLVTCALAFAAVPPSLAVQAAIAVPDLIPDVAAGSLLRATPLAEGPAGSTSYQLLYASRSSAGAPIAVSGFAFIPKGSPPKGGWPVLSYAHGTVGLADRCAPSQKIGTVEQLIGLSFVAQGIAVVATDYEGLGTPGRHPYIVGESEGRGVLDIVKAARQLPGESVSKRFVVWGHSQGGHAALFAGQLAKSWAPDLKLLGVIAGAPPSQLAAIADSVATSAYRGYLFMVAAGLQAANPALNLDDVLTDKAKQLLPIVDTGCSSAVFKAFSADPLDSLLKPDGLRSPAWSAALASNEPGTVRIPAPVLIIHGDRDEQVPVATSATLLSKMCRKKTVVERRVYPGQDHTGAALVSLFDVLAFVQARLAGVAAKSSCRK